MTVVQVWWWNANLDAPARGYWDQAMLADLLDGDLWWPADGYLFQPLEGDERPTDGAVVVVPGGANAEYVDRLNADLAELRWVLLIVTSDEEGRFPLDQVNHQRMKVWRQYGGMASERRYRPIPLGYTPGTRQHAAALDGPGDDLRVDWSFAGQVNQVRREQLVYALEALPEGVLKPSAGFAQGLAQDDYRDLLARTKVAPCPSGHVHVDSFRMYEALEAGCVPVVDMLAPSDTRPTTYWNDIFGQDFPLEGEEDWRWFFDAAAQALEDWPRRAAAVASWWLGAKRDLAYALQADVRALSRTARHVVELAPNDAITVVISTSPIPSNPSTAVLEETLASVRAQLPRAEVIIAMDGVRDEQAERAAAYDEFQRQVTWLASTRWRNVWPMYLGSHHHQALAARRAMAEVRTPLVLFVEHDTPLCGSIDWDGIVRLLLGRKVNLVRFHHEAHVLDAHQHLMVDSEPVVYDGVPLLRTMQWSQRPHVASRGFYQQLLTTYFGAESRTMIEDVMHGVLDFAWRERGIGGWRRWRTALYAPDGDMKRSLHSDGRGDDPKFDMVYAYDFAPPQGAPYPTRDRRG